MKQQTKNLIRRYQETKAQYLECYAEISALRDNLKESAFNTNDMVDIIYVMREISKLLNDLRKEVDGVQHQFENVGCLISIQRGDLEPIRTSLATGSPDLKMAAKIPSQTKDPENFSKLMDYLGVAKEAVEDKCVKPHWPGLVERISNETAMGKPLPPGIDPNSSYPVYSMRIRAKQNLDQIEV